MDLALSCQGLTLLSWQNYKKLLRTFEAAVTSHEISVTRLLTAASLPVKKFHPEITWEKSLFS